MKRLVILHDSLKAGARRDEADGLVQVGVVREEFLCLGWQVEVLPLSLDLKKAARDLARLKPDLVFNLVESVGGSGRLIHLAPALLDALGISYTGSKTEAMFLTNNKPLAKSLLVAAGIATPAWFPGGGGGGFRPGKYIVKSVWEHASVGLDEASVVRVSSREELDEAVARRRTLTDDECFAEAFIEGREFNISLISSPGRPLVLPPAEMLFHYPEGKERIVDYRAKWEPETPEYKNTCRTFIFPPEDRPLLGRLEKLAEDCWNVFELRGFARVDCRVDSRGKPWVLEINANPCLSPDGGFRAALAEAGIDFPRALKKIAPIEGEGE